MRNLLLLGIALLTIASVLAAAPPSSSFPKVTQYYDKINANEQTVMLVNDSNVLFDKIIFTLNKDATRARLNVQAMPDCPENAPQQPRLLQCLFIAPSNFEDGDVSNAIMYFKAPKNWLDANKFDETSIDLKRYSYAWNVGANLSEWKKLDTSLEDEDDSYAYYSAVSDGFSYFSITSDGTLAKENQIQEISSQTEQPLPVQTETYKYFVESTPNSKWSVDGRLVTIIVLGLLAIIVFRLRYSEHLVKPEPTHEEKHLEYLTDTVDHFIKAGYSPLTVKDELKRSGWKEWMIDYAFLKAKKLK